jgi:hypothetical protein
MTLEGLLSFGAEITPTVRLTRLSLWARSFDNKSDARRITLILIGEFDGYAHDHPP